jgi:hypothetical protein
MIIMKLIMHARTRARTHTQLQLGQIFWNNLTTENGFAKWKVEWQ